MPRAIYLSNQPSNLAEVYPPALQQKICQLCQIEPDIITEAKLLAHPDAFNRIAIVFSTWGMPALAVEQIRQCLPGLKIIFYAAGTVQYFARPYLKAGVRICSAWQANAVPVAEYAAAQILLANKGFFQGSRLTRQNYQAGREYCRLFPGNYQTSVGILGAGMIGSRVIELLRSHDLNIKVFDPFLPAARAKEMAVEKAELADIFADCQTISNHLADNDQTRGMLDRELFERMLPQATFINTGRGAQVVEEDLVAALKAEPARTAILDVTDPEPFTADSALLQLENVILTPHIAGSMNRELPRMAEYMVDDLQRWLHHQPLSHEVTLRMLEYMA